MKTNLTPENEAHLETLLALLRFSAKENSEVYELINNLFSLVHAVEFKNNFITNEISNIGSVQFHEQVNLINSLKMRLITEITTIN
jgi:hypothetical protein